MLLNLLSINKLGLKPDSSFNFIFAHIHCTQVMTLMRIWGMMILGRTWSVLQTRINVSWETYFN